MLKRTMKRVLQETTDKLNLTLLENRQLRERLEVYENQNSEEKLNELNEKLVELTEEIDNTRTNAENRYREYESEIRELEERNNSLTLELNRLKGEHFETKRYAEDLKHKLQTVSSSNTQTVEEVAPPEPPPVPTLITAEKKDETSFNYASTIISEIVIKTAAVTSRITASSDPNAAELKALAMGRCEMLKSDVLQTVTSDMIPEAKTSRMDKLLAEASDYLDGILGQLTQ